MSAAAARLGRVRLYLAHLRGGDGARGRRRVGQGAAKRRRGARRGCERGGAADET